MSRAELILIHTQGCRLQTLRVGGEREKDVVHPTGSPPEERSKPDDEVGGQPLQCGQLEGSLEDKPIETHSHSELEGLHGNLTNEKPAQNPPETKNKQEVVDNYF